MQHYPQSYETFVYEYEGMFCIDQIRPQEEVTIALSKNQVKWLIDALTIELVARKD